MSNFTFHACIRVLLVTCLSLCMAWSVKSNDQVFVDVHISVDEPILSQAMAINDWAFKTIPGVSVIRCFISRASRLAGEVVDFKNAHDPHVTLYLTAFPASNIPSLISVASAVAAKFKSSCSTSSGSVNVTGTYALLATSTPACLQYMSDAIVNAT
jgi:hypothetical protein